MSLSRGHARFRAASRCLLSGLVAATAITLTATPALATGLAITPTTPAGATTNTPLTWDISTSDATPTSCELDRGATVVNALADCAGSVSYDVSSDVAGTYTLVAYNDTAANVTAGATPETQSSSVDVLPTAPTPTAPATPSN